MKLVLAVIMSTSFLFSYEMNYDKNTDCFIRHLKVYKNQKWVAKIELKDGKNLFFSSPKSMFEVYHRPGKWSNLNIKEEDDFKNIIVTDFNTLEPINAKGAFFVYGSSVTSPAGDDLPAFDSYKAATEFSKKYHGSRVLNFQEVSNGLIRLLNGSI
jgi:nitrous oxide reductase accessory protein NosL